MKIYASVEKLLHPKNDPKIIAFHQSQPITLAEFRQQVIAVRLKILQGERWILSCHNSYYFAVGFFALLLEHKTILLPQNGLVQTLANIPGDIAGLLTDEKHSSSLRQILLSDQAISSQKNHMDFPTIPLNKNCIEMFTSGTTGQPKLIKKSWGNLYHEIEMLENLWGAELDHHAILSTVSHQHIYGLLFRLLWPILSGRAFVSHAFEYPETLCEYASQLDQKGLCTVLISSPAHLKRMSQLINLEKINTSISHIFSSGGPLSFITATEFSQYWGHTPIEVFGSTETGGIAYRQQAVEQTPWNVFNPVSIKIGPTDQQLLVKSPFTHVKNNDWCITGDQIEQLSDRLFLLKGRHDRIVKVEEKRLSLNEMENFLLKHPYIKEVKVLVLRNKRDVVACAIVLTELGISTFNQTGKLALNKELSAFLSTQFEKVLLPRKWRYLDDFIYNPQGKICDSSLSQLFSNEA